MDNSELYTLILSDADAGMRALLADYSSLVVAVVRSVLGGKFCDADIEACAADSICEFYLGFDSYDPEKGSIRSWLCVIARHNATDLLRRHARDDSALSPEEEIADLHTPEDEMIEAESRRELFAAIASLPDTDREIITDKYYLRMPSREIAESLGMTVSAVDTRAHRALKKLREALGNFR